MVRSLFYTGNIEHAKEYTAIACSLFESFVKRMTLRGIGSFVETVPLDKFVHARLVINGTIGSIQVHSSLSIAAKKKVLEMTRESVRCAWNIKPLKIPYPPDAARPDGFHIITPGTYTYYNGSGYGLFGLSNRRCIPEFGAPFYELELPFVADYSFFEDGGWSVRPFLWDGHAQSGWPGSLSSSWIIASARLTGVASLLDYAYVIDQWQMTGGYYVHAIDGLIPAKDGQVQHGQNIYGATFFSVSQSFFNIIRKSTTKVVAYYGGDLQNEDTGDYYEATVSVGNYINDENEILNTDVVCGRFFCEEAYYGNGVMPSSFLDVGHLSISIAGTTELGSLVHEAHVDIVPYEDWYFFSTTTNAVAEITQFEDDGTLTQTTIDIVVDFVSSNYLSEDARFQLVAMPGYPVRYIGMHIAMSFPELKMHSQCRNLVRHIVGFLELRLNFSQRGLSH